MNQHIESREGVLVCGSLEGIASRICLREAGHSGPHVIHEPEMGYFLLQTVCMPISFQIPETIAQLALCDKDWTWSE